MREKIFKVIEHTENKSIAGTVYDCLLILAIITSIIPLAFKETPPVFKIIEYIGLGFFILDYILRFITADYHSKLKGIKPFLKHPITLLAIIDLLAILPSLTPLNKVFKLLKLFKLVRTMEMHKFFKFIMRSKSFILISNVFKKKKRVLGAVASLAVGYILVSALVVFNIEPSSFDTFFDAVYWATVTLTSTGCSDIHPVTTIGRLVTMASSVFGVVIIAFPSGIITVGYLSEIMNKEHNIK